MMNEMVERVARAIWDTSADHPASMSWDTASITLGMARGVALYRRAARAAIQAMREPTRAMLVAGQEDLNENIDAAADTVWRAIIDEALRDDN